MCVKQNCGDFREKSGSFQHMRAFQKQLSAGVGICSLHTSPVEGSLLGLGSGQRDSGSNEATALQELFNSFSSATVKIPNCALLSEWNEDSKSSFKYDKLPR